ncbi:DUF4242 domain-containing protein [Nocardia nova]|uniref:DUF4242 domain-containing protein n=1 Tax=Nocardia nova TaxID=37330 RepID=A0A2S6AKB4_9NOCA|nr:DUF4242 domain-containing protein [Nocardia nova]PPJ24895.1 DUF4242 domain-containing protein [Nocardia nova]PPJ35657.1 DUF4242 domain-containing protein [Nocardia nova]
MSLYLYELVPTGEPGRTIGEFGAHADNAGGELIEAQVTTGAARIFAIAEFAGCAAPTLAADQVFAAAVDGPHQVRLVGADLATVKAARPAAGYLVEWDIPAEIDMDTYLARKKANAPKYADVPEVSFLRTYVREDTAKCLCFYDAPDEAAVRRARDAVSTPVDRLHTLADPRT